jgi:HPt (histidine-containing phosphotransfer) domain-containing protein
VARVIGSPEEETSIAAAAAFDLQAALEAVGGDRNLLTAVAETALEELPKLMDRVRSAVARDDAPALSRAAHMLKGALALFAPPLGERALVLEQMGVKGELSLAAAAVTELEQDVASLMVTLRELGGHHAKSETPGASSR